ncbi:MAG: hypothetical protein HQL37_06870 [Alphaproteobacteria bacterium]|nr:hypothetical protein [Alphaproteobacteria bacterium]
MDDELKAVLAKLADKIESEAAENAKFRAEVRSYMADTDKRLIGIEGRLGRIDEHLAGIDKRQDDQNAILAAMIPVKIAAVGGR